MAKLMRRTNKPCILIFLLSFLCLSLTAGVGSSNAQQVNASDVYELQRQVMEQMRREGESYLQDSRRQMEEQQRQQRRPPAIAYHNPLTDHMYVGDKIFSVRDRATALATIGQRNTSVPEGVGWQPWSESSYIDWVREMRGERPTASTSGNYSSIFNNCVVDKSRGIPNSAVPQVRAACDEIARNPSIFDRLRWSR
jgi:hypothetical protein